MAIRPPNTTMYAIITATTISMTAYTLCSFYRSAGTYAVRPRTARGLRHSRRGAEGWEDRAAHDGMSRVAEYPFSYNASTIDIAADGTGSAGVGYSELLNLASRRAASSRVVRRVAPRRILITLRTVLAGLREVLVAAEQRVRTDDPRVREPEAAVDGEGLGAR